ncbi:MAG: DUF3108 domain-containing protein [Candidatus Cyclobacteriaceae bacterium M2_1C_046]
MSKYVIALVGILIIGSGFLVINDNANYIHVPHESFGRGEVLEYKMTYGFITIGKGMMKINPKMYRVNYRESYKIDVYGKTSGMIDWIAQVDDHWGEYVDTAALVPHMFYRNIKEGRYRKNEITRFDHNTNNIEVKTVNNKTGEFKEPMYYAAPDNIRSMLSGYLYLRAFDFDTIPEGSTFSMDGFFEDTFYNLEVIYGGLEEVNTRVGKIQCHKLIPIMPENKIFNGENSITAYISADENKIPVRVDANMFIGKAAVELISHEGLKNDLQVY